jgi:hypothetical protein
MSISFLTTALLIISVVTNLTVEGIKKLLEDTSVKYSSNILAVVISVVIACIVCVVYLIMNNISFSLMIVVEIIVLMYLSFLVSVIGYDKVMQMIKQVQNPGEK